MYVYKLEHKVLVNKQQQELKIKFPKKNITYLVDVN